ncbi:hypothetical protein NL676_030579 [Syzygium grande]|nr:hypothetical protein NL676_030579 [Syzygium grande]
MNGERVKVGDHNVKAYSTSQLAQCVLLHELARELQDTQVISTLARTAGVSNFLLVWPHSSRTSLIGMGIKGTA